ncbi:SRPBCC family protein [Streptomyces sp. NPDC007088]|uniref:SRPBCC family protein n=1 Tax=Streptomyces sp. NPDC007088 TaxID=3364773 RepID=UPI003677F93C
MAAEKSGAKDEEKPSALEHLFEEVTSHLEALAQHLADKAGDKVSDLTGKLSDIAEGTGARAGARVLGGESPVKALFSEKTKDVKSNVVGKVKGAFGKGGGGDEGSGGGGGGGGAAGDLKITNIIETLDVGVPVRTAYDHWTQFEDFSGFMKGVKSVDQKDEVSTNWNVKVAFSARSWEATIEEQVPDDRIVWSSEGAKGSTHGAVSFHELAPNLTRIVVVVEYSPAGFFEKTGNLWRAQGRRLRLDLKHFARHVTFAEEDEIEGWRGEVRDGEVVRSHEDGLKDDEQDEDAGPEDEENENGVEDAENGDEAEEEDDEDDEDADETEDARV